VNKLLGLILMVICPCSWAQALRSVDSIETAGKLEPVSALHALEEGRAHNAADRTKDALLAYPAIEARANYFAKRLEKKLLGDYAQEVLILSPILTGQVSLNVFDLNVSLDYREQRGRVQYVYSF
jgi:hypothetical protein